MANKIKMKETNDNKVELINDSDDDLKDNGDDKKKHSCCWIFKLETGIATIIYLDLLMFGVILTTSAMSMRDGLRNEKKSNNSNVHRLKKKKTSFILFNLVTDYTLILVMLVKMYSAIVYFYTLVHKGNKDEEFLFDEQGDKKWKARVLSR